MPTRFLRPALTRSLCTLVAATALWRAAVKNQFMAVLHYFHPLLSTGSQKIFVASAMLLFVAAPSRSEAGLMLNPGTVLANTAQRNASFPVTAAFDQSGLSTGYTSGVTDFDTYIAGNPTHPVNAANVFYLPNDFVTSGFINLDLGSAFVLEGLALWNWGSAAGGPGITGMNIYSSPDATFTAPVLLDTFGFVIAGGNAQVKQFTTPTSTQYVRLEMTGPRSVGFGELAFEVVPEPSSAVLLLGSAALLALRRRRASAR